MESKEIISCIIKAMFDILEADIVIIQETKIQRKDLRDEMVLIPGWDMYFSLPKHKKGYSGVAIYTRSAICAPIRAEEGITGVLIPPKSSTSFRDLPTEFQIGGYPTTSQLSDCSLDALKLDSEGRCVILEFPAFVLIGTYCPAIRDESREEFRIGFLKALDARVRNLVKLGKRVFLAGDLNIALEEIDTAHAEEQMRNCGISIEEFISTPARRMLHQLLLNGQVIGQRDKGREKSVMVDLCRDFHPTRSQMFTCWDQRINARPGNFGSRIDYVLCSEGWKDWFCQSDIQEGLMGSDHCPVFAVLKDRVSIDGKSIHIRDIMSSGIFKDGIRQREWSTKDLLPMSAKLLPEFDRRINIRDMFAKHSASNVTDNSQAFSMPRIESSPSAATQSVSLNQAKKQNQLPCINGKREKDSEGPQNDFMENPLNLDDTASSSSSSLGLSKPPKRANQTSVFLTRPSKSAKLSAVDIAVDQKPLGKGQKTLKGFFKAKVPETVKNMEIRHAEGVPNLTKSTSNPETSIKEDDVDQTPAKESWSKLLTKRMAPRCHHDEPCISLVTKKPGMNHGRSFYICPRPIGPSGQKEKDSLWRCSTFIWNSDWTGND